MADDKLAKVEDQSGGAIEPSSLKELYALAGHAAASGFFGASNQAQALMIMMAGRDIGFSYTQSLRAFHVIKGKPSLSATAMVAVCLNSGKCEFFRCVEATPESVTWETKRVGNPVRQLTFTMKEAVESGLTTEMYRKFPRQMLNARCTTSLAREVYPELLMGLYDPDELENVGDSAPLQPIPKPNVKAPPREPFKSEPKIQDAEIIDDHPTLAATPAAKAAEPIDPEKASLCDRFIVDFIEASSREQVLQIRDDSKAVCGSIPALYKRLREEYIKAIKRFPEVRQEAEEDAAQ